MAYFLDAQALAGGHIVVTHERPNNSVHVVKIPNVCLGVGVTCMTPVEMLEAMARALFKSWFVDFDPVRAKAEGRDLGLPMPLADRFPPPRGIGTWRDTRGVGGGGY